MSFLLLNSCLAIFSPPVPTVRFDPQNYTVPEGSPANITVVVDMPPATECRVTVTTMDLTAECERVVCVCVCVCVCVLYCNMYICKC